MGHAHPQLKKRLENAYFTHFPAQISAIHTRIIYALLRYFCVYFMFFNPSISHIIYIILRPLKILEAK